jgi:hypothetical protein
MNKHTKIAILVAPILTILGFALADFWEESKAEKVRAFELVPFGHCDVSHQKCILKSGEFEVNVMDEKGITTVNSTFPIDKVTLFLVDKESNVTAFPLGMKDSPYYWKRETPLGSFVANKGDSYKLRLIVEIKGGKYFSEFYTQNAQ